MKKYRSFYLLFSIGMLSLLLSCTAQSDSTTERQPATYELILYEQMEDGNWIKEKKTVTVWAVEDFWAQYMDWEIIDLNKNSISLKKPYTK